MHENRGNPSNFSPSISNSTITSLGCRCYSLSTSSYLLLVIFLYPREVSTTVLDLLPCGKLRLPGIHLYLKECASERGVVTGVALRSSG